MLLTLPILHCRPCYSRMSSQVPDILKDILAIILLEKLYTDCPSSLFTAGASGGLDICLPPANLKFTAPQLSETKIRALVRHPLFVFSRTICPFLLLPFSSGFYKEISRWILVRHVDLADATMSNTKSKGSSSSTSDIASRVPEGVSEVNTYHLFKDRWDQLYDQWSGKEKH
jgi:hypothetical protein